MATRVRTRWSGGNSLFILVSIVVFVWGLERWRRHAAAKAGASEQTRLAALARCLLGSDGITLMRSPDAARRRLRALAMNTPSLASVTWVDHCVPLARSLALHASEVDNTRAITMSQTRVVEGSRLLADAVARVGLVWRIRTGDPELDMDLVADRLSRLASELQLATADLTLNAGDSPVAPAVRPLPAGALLATQGLEPTHVGDPSAFLVGSPLPAVSEVLRAGPSYRLHVLANEPAFAWSVNARGVVRLDTLFEPSEDGLAPLRWLRPGDKPVEERITSVNDPLQGVHVSLDETMTGLTRWLTEWTPWSGTVLARFSPGHPPTAVTLAAPVNDGASRSRRSAGEWSTALDEHVAVAGLGAGAVVAYTQGSERGSAVLEIASTLADSARASVVRISERPLGSASAGLQFCGRGDDELDLVVASAREWLVLRVDAETVSEKLRVVAAPGELFDSRLVVRCTPARLVAYGRERPLHSPVIACGAGSADCVHVSTPPTSVLTSMPVYTTRAPSGRAMAHPEWPVAIADAGGTLVAVRGVGSVVSVVTRPADSTDWVGDTAIFDAATSVHGYVVEGLNVYAEGDDIVIAVAAPDGLHILSLQRRSLPRS